MMPVIAEENFGIDPKSWQYGVLYACFGLGAALGAVSVGTVFAQRVEGRGCCARRSSRSRSCSRCSRCCASPRSAYPGRRCCSATRTSSSITCAVDGAPVAPRRRRTGPGHGAVDHGLRRHRAGRRAGRRLAQPRTSRSPAICSRARSGRSCSRCGRMPVALHARVRPRSEQIRHDRRHGEEPRGRSRHAGERTGGGAYAGVRTRVTELIRGADPTALESIAPATPEWRVRDVLAHLVGVTDDVIRALDGVATDPWTRRAGRCPARRECRRPVGGVDRDGRAVRGRAGRCAVEISGQALFDAVTHEHDIRSALGVPGARDTDAVELAWEWILGARTRGGAPCMCFVTEDGEDTSGVGEVVATVEAPRFELLRAVTGRRTAAEIEGYDWDPGPRSRPHPRLVQSLHVPRNVAGRITVIARFLATR